MMRFSSSFFFIWLSVWKWLFWVYFLFMGITSV